MKFAIQNIFRTTAVAFAVALAFSGNAHAQAVTLGGGTVSSTVDNSQIAIGGNAATTGGNETAIGYGATVNDTAGMAFGYNAVVNGIGGIAIGSGTNAAQDAVALGYSSTASGLQSLSFGFQTTASGQGAIAIGPESSANATQSTALGIDAQSSGAGSVALGAGSTDGGLANVVSVGNSVTQRRIINVAAGINSSDAATMGQLGSMAAALGGGAGYSSSTGAWTAPVFTVPTTSGSTSYGTVSAALAGIGARVTTLETTVADLPTSTSSSTPPASSSSTSSSSTVSSSQVQQIVQQANTYTDQQMSGISNQIGQLSSAVSSLGNQINSVDSMARAGIAADAALTRTAAMPYAPGHVVVMTGAATYRGQAAGALGVGYWTADGRNSINFGAAYGGSNSGVYSAGYAHIF